MGLRTPPPRHVVITGASSGIGAALARHYAGTGIKLSLLSRNVERLEAVAAICRDRGADVTIQSGDVADGDSMAQWLVACDTAQPVDLVIANAGIGGDNVMAGSAGETLAAAGRIVATNLGGVLNSIVPLLPRLVARGRGGVVIISSLAGFIALPDAPVYGATKAGARMYGLALRRLLGPRGIAVTVVSPGFIDTPMSASLKTKLPFLWTAERAARHIAAGVARGRREMIFPWQLALAIKLVSLLPAAWADRILAAATRNKS